MTTKNNRLANNCDDTRLPRHLYWRSCEGCGSALTSERYCRSCRVFAADALMPFLCDVCDRPATETFESAGYMRARCDTHRVDPDFANAGRVLARRIRTVQR